jgi:hypothetical protein
MNNLKEMCTLRKVYNCKVCGNSLFFVTKNRMLISYADIMRNGNTLYNLKERLNYRGITSIKCMNCNKEFVIDWRHGFPEQLIDTTVLKDFGV